VKTTNAERRRTYRLRHPERAREQDRAAKAKLRREALAAYGAACACCGESAEPFLAIDHIGGGGTAHRQEVGAGHRFFRWLKKNGWPEGFRVLCANCNQATAWGRVCPHEEARRVA
jgi:hypothetical protein